MVIVIVWFMLGISIVVLMNCHVGIISCYAMRCIDAFISHASISILRMFENLNWHRKLVIVM